MKLITKFTQFLYRLWYFRKYRRFDGYQKRIQKAVTDQEIDRMILKHQIVRYMRRYLKVGANSKYIPRDNKSREQVRQQVFGRFGCQMALLGLTINHKLELCTP